MEDRLAGAMDGTGREKGKDILSIQVKCQSLIGVERTVEERGKQPMS